MRIWTLFLIVAAMFLQGCAAVSPTPQQLADPDGQFLPLDVNGTQLTVHYKEAGKGETNFVLLHGFGASVYSWREVLGAFGALGRAAAFDRPAFGLTSRPMPGQWDGPNPYSGAFQPELTAAFMDALGMEKAVLVGNSAGGAVAVQTALAYPERVEALILVAPAVHIMGGSGMIPLPRVLLQGRLAREIGPVALRLAFPRFGESLLNAAWHAPDQITPEIEAEYKKPLRLPNWDRALWELLIAERASDLSEHVFDLTLPTLVITGDDDRVVPTARSVRLAEEWAAAEGVVLPSCGHVPQEECPAAFMEAVEDFLSAQKSSD